MNDSMLYFTFVTASIAYAGASLGYFMMMAVVNLFRLWAGREYGGLDWLLGFNVFAFAFTVFAVTGVAHSINVVDGVVLVQDGGDGGDLEIRLSSINRTLEA